MSPKGIYDHSNQRVYEGSKQERHRLAAGRYCEQHPERGRKYYSMHPELAIKERENYHLNIEMARFLSNFKHKAQKLALACECEFCGSTERLERHHPEYEYPEIFVTCCRKCHKWINKGCD